MSTATSPMPLRLAIWNLKRSRNRLAEFPNSTSTKTPSFAKSPRSARSAGVPRGRPAATGSAFQPLSRSVSWRCRFSAAWSTGNRAKPFLPPSRLDCLFGVAGRPAAVNGSATRRGTSAPPKASINSSYSCGNPCSTIVSPNRWLSEAIFNIGLLRRRSWEPTPPTGVTHGHPARASHQRRTLFDLGRGVLLGTRERSRPRRVGVVAIGERACPGSDLGGSCSAPTHRPYLSVSRWPPRRACPRSPGSHRSRRG